jgi:hypothetical protein
MRLLAFGLMAAVLAAAALPGAASAADSKPSIGVGDAKSHAQAMTEVPPLIQQTAINCTPTDANVVTGKSNEGGDKGAVTKIYEMVCQQGLGWMIFAPTGGTPNAFDCLALSTRKPKQGEKDTGQVFCRLAPNANPVSGVQAVVTQAGSNCQVSQARWMGTSSDNKLDQYEAACSDGSAVVLQVPRIGGAQKLTAINCMDVKPGECSYFPKEKYLAALTSMSQGSNRQCQITDGRYIGSTPEHHTFFEVACSEATQGYVLETDAASKYVRAIDCGRASSMGLGCELTSAAAVQTGENATYTKAAKEIGFDCDVSGYHSFGVDSKTGREVVELACTGHPESYLALLPVDKGQTGEYKNCLRAAGVGLKCVLSPIDATYAKVSSDVSKSGKTCQVTGGREIGSTAAGDDYVEVACSAGPGLVLTYAQRTDAVKSSQTCAAAKGVGLSCTLSK